MINWVKNLFKLKQKPWHRESYEDQANRLYEHFKGLYGDKIQLLRKGSSYKIVNNLYEEEFKMFSRWQNGIKEVDYKWFYINKCKTYENMFLEEEIV